MRKPRHRPRRSAERSPPPSDVRAALGRPAVAASPSPTEGGQHGTLYVLRRTNACVPPIRLPCLPIRLHACLPCPALPALPALERGASRHAQLGTRQARERRARPGAALPVRPVLHRAPLWQCGPGSRASLASGHTARINSKQATARSRP
eukprot:scaffold5972_cov53-Phaeocystis_antarctica.AAC.2